MRSAILAIALTILGASAAMAVEMKSINEILSFEASPANSQYAIKRCSALYILLAGLMVGEDEAPSIVKAIASIADRMCVSPCGTLHYVARDRKSV